jgi:hypothetical protein
LARPHNSFTTLRGAFHEERVAAVIDET